MFVLNFQITIVKYIINIEQMSVSFLRLSNTKVALTCTGQ